MALQLVCLIIIGFSYVAYTPPVALSNAGEIYVSKGTGAADSNACTSTTAACATISAAGVKAGAAAGKVILGATTQSGPYQETATTAVGGNLEIVGTGRTTCFLTKATNADYALFTYTASTTASLTVSGLTVLLAHSSRYSDGVFCASATATGGSIAVTFTNCRFTMAAGVTEIYGAFFITHPDVSTTASATQTASLRLDGCLVDGICLGRTVAQSFISCVKISTLELVGCSFANMEIVTTAALQNESFGGVVFNVNKTISGQLLVSNCVCVGIRFAGDNNPLVDQRGGGVGYLVEGSMVGLNHLIEDSVFWNCSTAKGQGGGVLKIASNTGGRTDRPDRKISINNVTCVDCRAEGTITTHGGAFSLLRYCHTNISSSCFVRCASRNVGGAVAIRYHYYDGDGTNESYIEDCTFIECRAASGGAIAIYEWINLTVTRCLFLNNVATSKGHDIHSQNDCTLIISNSYSRKDASSSILPIVCDGTGTLVCGSFTACTGNACDSPCAAGYTLLSNGTCAVECHYFAAHGTGESYGAEGHTECVDACPAGTYDSRYTGTLGSGTERYYCSLKCPFRIPQPSTGCRYTDDPANDCVVSLDGTACVYATDCPEFTSPQTTPPNSFLACAWDNCASRTANDSNCGHDGLNCHYFAEHGTGDYTGAEFTECLQTCPAKYEGRAEGTAGSERYYCSLKCSFRTSQAGTGCSYPTDPADHCYVNADNTACVQSSECAEFSSPQNNSTPSSILACVWDDCGTRTANNNNCGHDTPACHYFAEHGTGDYTGTTECVETCPADKYEGRIEGTVGSGTERYYCSLKCPFRTPQPDTGCTYPDDPAEDCFTNRDGTACESSPSGSANRCFVSTYLFIVFFFICLFV